MSSVLDPSHGLSLPVLHTFATMLRDSGVVLLRLPEHAARVLRRAHVSAEHGFDTKFDSASTGALIDTGYSVLRDQRKELFDVCEGAPLLPHPCGELTNEVGGRVESRVLKLCHIHSYHKLVANARSHARMYFNLFCDQKSNPEGCIKDQTPVFISMTTMGSELTGTRLFILLSDRAWTLTPNIFIDSILPRPRVVMVGSSPLMGVPRCRHV